MRDGIVRRRIFEWAALALLFWTAVSALGAATSPVATDRLRTYEFDIFGPSTEAALKQAALHCVRSAVGEFYCSDEMLLARELLGRYLEKSYGRFIRSQKVLSRRESQGMVYLRVSIIVDVGALEKDLREKRFFYKPKRRPFFYVSVAETVDGQPTSGEPISRTAIQESLQKLLMRYEPRVIYSNAPNLDLSADALQLAAAREAAQRAGVEVLLTGRVELQLSRREKIHFSDFTFYRAKARLVLIRVDDGKTLASGAYEAEAGHTDAEAAKRVAASRACAKILEDLIPSFALRWERTMTDNVEFQVMLAGVNPREASLVKERLETSLRDVRVYQRSMFEDVAVFNLYYPPGKVGPGERGRVEKVLRDLESPHFKVLPGKTPKQIIARRVS